MNRRQLAFVVILNALISLVIAVAVVWGVEWRRPDVEELAAVYTPAATPLMAVTFTPTPQAAEAAAQPDSAEGPTAAPTVVSEDSIYVVQAGDSLSGLAQRFNVSVAAIMAVNGLTNPDFVFSGQRLVIPQAGQENVTATATPTPIPSVNAGIRIASFAASGELGSESVSVENNSDLAVNLQGWQLSGGEGRTYTFGNILLFPGSGVVLFTGTGNDTSVAVYWNRSEPVWQSGTVAQLLNAEGTTVSQLTVP